MDAVNHGWPGETRDRSSASDKPRATVIEQALSALDATDEVNLRPLAYQDGVPVVLGTQSGRSIRWRCPYCYASVRKGERDYHVHGVDTAGGEGEPPYYAVRQSHCRSASSPFAGRTVFVLVTRREP